VVFGAAKGPDPAGRVPNEKSVRLFGSAEHRTGEDFKLAQRVWGTSTKEGEKTRHLGMESLSARTGEFRLSCDPV